jgi:hypothetical protein
MNIVVEVTSVTSILMKCFVRVRDLLIKIQDERYRRPGRLSQFLQAADSGYDDLYDHRPGAGSVEAIYYEGRVYSEQHRQCL